VNGCIAEDLQSTNTDDDEEEDFVGPQSQIVCLIKVLFLVKNIFKWSPGMRPANVEDWLAFSVGCMESFTDDLSVAATLAATYGVLHCGDYEPFYNALARLFENESGNVVGAAFRAVCRFVRELPAELMTGAGECRAMALRWELACQDIEADHEASPFNLQTNMYRFFAALATKSFNEFPLELFIDHGNRVRSAFERSQYIGVLR
jgi:hypothetical protein